MNYFKLKSLIILVVVAFSIIGCATATWVKTKSGDDLFKLKNYDGAIEEYSEAIKADTNNFRAYFKRGFAYRMNGRYDTAIEDYNKAISLRPNYVDAYNSRGVAYYMKNQNDKAIEDYNKAISIDSEYATAYENRGRAYQKKGQYDMARKDFNKVILLKPQTTIVYVEDYVNDDLATKTWRATYNDKEFIPIKEEIIKRLVAETRVFDEAEKNKLINNAEKEFRFEEDGSVKFLHYNTCDQLQRKLFEHLTKSFKEEYSNSYVPVRYQYNSFKNSSNPYNLEPPRNTSGTWLVKTTTSEGKGIVTAFYFDDEGKQRNLILAVVYQVTSRGCPNSTTAVADIKYMGHKVPSSALFQSTEHQFFNTTKNNYDAIYSGLSGDVEILFPKIEEVLEKMTRKSMIVTGHKQYDSAISNIMNDFDSARRNRYTTPGPEQVINLGERRYPVEFNIVLSRLQRSLKAYKFDEKASRFTSTYTVSPVQGYQWQNPVSDIVITANIFPEAGGKTAVVYEMKYEPVKDTFTNLDVFSEKSAAEIFKVQIGEIEKAIR